MTEPTPNLPTSANAEVRPHDTTFGVFRPVGHVLVSFAHSADADAATLALQQAGYAGEDVQRYTPAQMQAQAEQDMHTATALSHLGQELNLVRAQHALALLGHSFVLVRTRDDDDVRRVAEIALRFHASRAQHYGHLLIEELVPVGSTDQQVAESPDRGLDAQTPSGQEAPGRD